MAGFHTPNNGFLVSWAKQGRLMLNAVLTVREQEPNSHRDQGWEGFTDTIIKRVNARASRVVFVWWGNYAQKRTPWLTVRIARLFQPVFNVSLLSVQLDFDRLGQAFDGKHQTAGAGNRFLSLRLKEKKALAAF